MAGQVPKRSGVVAEINVTPFVDVVLVLLVILMVTSLDIARAALSVDLPKAASAGDAVPSTLSVLIEPTGQVLLDGEPVDEAALATRVRREKDADSEVRAVIAADQSASYGAVVRVIDIVKQSGVAAFALDLERGSPP